MTEPEICCGADPADGTDERPLRSMSGCAALVGWTGQFVGRSDVLVVGLERSFHATLNARTSRLPGWSGSTHPQRWSTAACASKFARMAGRMGNACVAFRPHNGVRGLEGPHAFAPRRSWATRGWMPAITWLYAVRWESGCRTAGPIAADGRQCCRVRHADSATSTPTVSPRNGSTDRCHGLVARHERVCATRSNVQCGITGRGARDTRQRQPRPSAPLDRPSDGQRGGLRECPPSGDAASVGATDHQRLDHTR